MWLNSPLCVVLRRVRVSDVETMSCHPIAWGMCVRADRGSGVAIDGGLPNRLAPFSSRGTTGLYAPRPAVTTSGRRKARQVVVLALVVLAQLVVILNATIVTVALPSIQRDLGFSTDGLTWVVNAYILVLGAFLVPAGRAGDLFGRKKTFIIGISLFALGSFVAGASGAQNMLLAGRVVQGLGAALLLPTTLSMLATSFPDGPRRHRALALWGGINSAAAGGALLVGGVLTDRLSWSAIFFVNAILGVLIAVAAAACMTGSSRSARAARIDGFGAVTLTLAAAAAVYTMTSARLNGWMSVVTVASALLAAFFIGAFVGIERVHREPLVRLSHFRSRTLATANVVACVIAGASMAMVYLMTLYFQDVLGFSALETGLAFAPITAATLLGSLATHPAIRRFGFRAALLTSLTVMGIGVTLLTRISPASSYSVDVLPALIVAFGGAGCGAVAAVILATTKISDGDAGLVSGLIGGSQQIGAAFWLAVFTSIATARAAGSSFADPPSVALVDGFRFAFWSLACLALLTACVVAMVLRRDQKPR